MTRTGVSPVVAAALCLLAVSALGVGVAADPNDTDDGFFAWGEDGDGSPVSVLSEPLTLVTVLVVGTAVAVVVERRSSGAEDSGAEREPTPLERAGRAAGRAAGRLSGADADPRALERDWRELATALGIEDPRRCTPETVRERALEAGVDREYALGLVDSFEVVRSGGAGDRREREAAAALREFAAAYADDGTEG